MRKFMSAVAVIVLLGVSSATQAGGVFIENPGHDVDNINDNPGNADVTIEFTPPHSSSTDVAVNPPSGFMDVGNNRSEEVSENESFTNSGIEVSIVVGP